MPGRAVPRLAARVEDAFEEWGRVSKGRLCDYSGITYESLAEQGATQWPFPEGEARRPRLYADGQFPTPDGRAKLIARIGSRFRSSPAATIRCAQYRAHGGALAHAHQDARGADSGAALAAGLAGDESARRQTARAAQPRPSGCGLAARARFQGVELRLTEIIAPGQVFMPFHFFETNVNEVTQSAFDPISREPNYKQCAVRVVPSA